MTHHRIEFVKLFYSLEQFFIRHVHILSQITNIFFIRRKELVQRRVEQAHRNRSSAHSLIYAFEVSALHREYLCESFFSLSAVARYYHLAYSLYSVLCKEHMLCTAESDTFCAEFYSLLSISRTVRISTHSQAAKLIRPAHDYCKISCKFCINSRKHSFIHIACAAVDGQAILICENRAILKRNSAVFLAYSDFAAACDAAGAHTARDHSGMRRHTSSRSKYALSGIHAFYIFRRGFHTAEHHLFPCRRLFYRFFSREYYFSRRCTRRRRKT